MKVKEAIIVAGGLGTRLQNVVCDIPKPMAPVGDRPFLEILIGCLTRNGIGKAVLAIGYKADYIRDYFTKNVPRGIVLKFSVETKPLGTGGCVKKALLDIEGENVIVINGDTFFDINFQKLIECHRRSSADITIALKKMADCSRYGTVLLNNTGRIIGFGEKKRSSAGLINGGIYVASKKVLMPMPDKFSFEKDLLERHHGDMKIYGCLFDGYFIDIGIPEDYEKAQSELIKY